MSDFTGMEQSFGSLVAGLPPAFYEPPSTTELQPQDVAFRHLQGAAAIAGVMHLRSEIQLPASALGDPGFALREKKETKSAWSVPSCATVRPSAPSACCR